MGVGPNRIEVASSSKRRYEIIDSAWDRFADYIGEYRMKTPISLEEFEQIFLKLNQNGEYTVLKDKILHSFRYDSYSWPLVERDPK